MEIFFFKLLRPMYPGAMPNIRLNLFNVVLILDLSRTQSLNLLTGSMSAIINRNLPVRFGLVPVVESEDGMATRYTPNIWHTEETGISGKKMARIFYHLVGKYGRKKTLEFFRLVCSTICNCFII